MAAPIKSNVDLGFVEEDCDLRLLKSRFFPSKIGGKPAWLSLTDLPSPDDLTCTKCGSQCVFLLQVYAPYEEDERGFHRTIFLFICRNPVCCTSNSNSNFKVFRSQLRKENDFYSSVPPDEDNPDDELEETGKVGVALCVVCGSAGPKRCAKCHRAGYCGKEHQTLHWKAGHKKKCSPESEQEVVVPNLLFPEADLVMEAETISMLIEDMVEKSELDNIQDYQDYLKANPDKSEADHIQEYQKYIKDHQDKGGSGLDTEELEKSAVSESPDDKQFAKFKAKTSTPPDQVLRYHRGGEPVWVTASHIPKPSEIPVCSCGAQKQFEFQVLPQLLIHLKVDSLGDSIDWGTLCVYTCSQSCDIGNKYHEEFLWKQDIGDGKSQT